MARPLHKLSSKEAEATTHPGRHGDGGGLYLHVRPDGRRAWAFIYRWRGRQKEMGLGSFVPADAEKGVRYEHTSLAEARQKAAAARAALAEGVDPMVARHATTTAPTFGAFADELINDLAGGFRNDKHIAQWRMTLGDTYCKKLRLRLVDEITTGDVLDVVKPIWSTRAETASRIRGRIERVLDAAKARGLRTGENPARWRGHLDALLPARQKLTRGHHAAMHYADLPAFLKRLRTADGVSARALELTILTAARSGEALGAMWAEFDLEAGVWTVPAERMKAGREHRVPLSAPALAIVKKLSELRVSSFVFPGRPKKPLSNMALAMTMRRMKVGQFTVHGFRSSFRTWVSEETEFPREIAEEALAHTVGNAVERAYRRGDALEKRRALMDAWAAFCSGETGSQHQKKRTK